MADALGSAFISGLSIGCVVIGILCLAGALAALRALPGRSAASHPDAAPLAVSAR